MNKEKQLSSNMEDYLEAVMVLEETNGVARVRDISDHLKVTKASVSSALKNLSKAGFILHERYGYVALTPKGEETAAKIKGRHDMLVDFLENILDLKKSIAEEDACKIEHVLSSETSHRLAKFVAFVDTVSGGEEPEWIKGFKKYLKTGKKTRCRYKE